MDIIRETETEENWNSRNRVPRQEDHEESREELRTQEGSPPPDGSQGEDHPKRTSDAQEITQEEARGEQDPDEEIPKTKKKIRRDQDCLHD